MTTPPTTTPPTPEEHPLKPFLPPDAELLMLGSFPPQRKRWSMDFYYPNMQNDMWRIYGLVFFGDREHFLTGDRKRFSQERISAFLEEKGIAVGDTVEAAIRLRDNASDQFLEVVRPLDLQGLLTRIPHCRAVMTTGQKATDTLLNMIGARVPGVGGSTPFTFMGREMRFYRMPSSSRAYPKPLVEKAEIYKTMFREIGML